MTSRRFGGDSQRTRFENTERPSQSSQAGVRDIRQMQAMMQENSRLERRQDLERRIGKSIEPQYVTSDVLRPIKLACEKEYFTGFDNKKVLDACEKVTLFNRELSNETQNTYRSRHGDISKDNAIDAIAFIFKETDKSTDLNIRRSARQQILNSLAEVPRQQPEAQARPSDAQVYATSQRGPSFHKATQQVDLSAQDDQSEEFHEPSSTNTGKGKEKVLHREQKEIENPKQRKKAKKRIKNTKSIWKKHPTENAIKLQELENARNNTDDELAVVDKYVKRRFIKDEEIEDLD